MRNIKILLIGALVVGCCCEVPYQQGYILSEGSSHEGGAVTTAPKLEEVSALLLRDSSKEV